MRVLGLCVADTRGRPKHIALAVSERRVQQWPPISGPLVSRNLEHECEPLIVERPRRALDQKAQRIDECPGAIAPNARHRSALARVPNSPAPGSVAVSEGDPKEHLVIEGPPLVDPARRHENNQGITPYLHDALEDSADEQLGLCRRRAKWAAFSRLRIRMAGPSRATCCDGEGRDGENDAKTQSRPCHEYPLLSLRSG